MYFLFALFKIGWWLLALYLVGVALNYETFGHRAMAVLLSFTSLLIVYILGRFDGYPKSWWE